MKRTVLCIAALSALVLPLPAGTNEALAAGGAPVMASTPVMDQIRDYQGPRDRYALEELFNRPANKVVRQLPEIALSDGVTAVIIAARIEPVPGNPVNFTLDGAEMLSMKNIRGDDWQIKALPARGTTQMSLVVLQGERKIVYPLLVAPPAPAETDLTEYGSQQFFASEKDRLDLNRDGQKDYVDDYIYMANYLVKQGSAGRDRSARKQRALQRTLKVTPPTPVKNYDPKDFPD